MKKFLLIIFFVLISVFVLTFAPTKDTVLAETDTTSTGSAEINSFELFWPIVAGRVRGDFLYPLKTFKEEVRKFLIFNDGKKSQYYSFLSTKRLVEYEKLILVKKDHENAEKTLKDYEKNVEKGNDLEEFEKQKEFIDSISTKVDESQKPLIQGALSVLEFRIEEFKI